MATPLQFLLALLWSLAACMALIVHAIKAHWPGLFRLWTFGAVLLCLAFIFQRVTA